MKFEKYETYWCISPKEEWNEEKPMVKPWQGVLNINQGDRGAVWTMHPLTSITSHHFSPDYVDLRTKCSVYHTEEEARDAYVLAETDRLIAILDQLKLGIIDLNDFRGE